MKTLGRTLVSIIMILTLGTALLIAADGGLVIRSPLFGPMDRPIAQESELRQQSFAEQLGLGATPSRSDQERVLAAISSEEYPVTPGDTYRLVYLDGLKTVTVELQADEKQSVTIPGLGTIEGAGMTFPALRTEILSMVRTYHSYSNPQLVLIATGSFTVSVIGEVSGTRVLPAWGLSRLSEVVQSATPWASSRRVEIRHRDGSSDTYDLYQALREGALDQDPLLRSGDVIVLTRAEKIVQLGGNVYRKGTFQLVEGDTLSTLITGYGGGVLSRADVQQIRIQRYNDTAKRWDVLYANLIEEPWFALRHQDQVIIDTLLPSIQSITIEGAIASSEAHDSLSSTALMGYPSGRIFYQFYPQETLRQLLTTISSRLLTVSDLDGSYLLRDGERIAVKVQQILYGNDTQGSLQLKAGDTLLIPFNQRLVSVGGAVVRSGVFAYVPDKEANYYIALAGGVSDDATYPLKIKVLGPDGKKIPSDGPIPAESTISVEKNTFVKDIAPTVAVIGLVSSILGIVAVTLSIILDAKKL
jgi:polysaccharide export outer membrane protein